jgi:hypothetical protein
MKKKKTDGTSSKGKKKQQQTMFNFMFPKTTTPVLKQNKHKKAVAKSTFNMHKRRKVNNPKKTLFSSIMSFFKPSNKLQAQNLGEFSDDEASVHDDSNNDEDDVEIDDEETPSDIEFQVDDADFDSLQQQDRYIHTHTRAQTHTHTRIHAKHIYYNDISNLTLVCLHHRNGWDDVVSSRANVDVYAPIPSSRQRKLVPNFNANSDKLATSFKDNFYSINTKEKVEMNNMKASKVILNIKGSDHQYEMVVSGYSSNKQDVDVTLINDFEGEDAKILHKSLSTVM